MSKIKFIARKKLLVQGGSILLHLLVIDDDEKITALLRRSLEFEGYRVTTAADGEKGLALAAQTKPDLVILDLMLPSLDGYQVCQRLRDTYPKIPVLMLTAKDDVKDKVKGLTLGADDYLVKPFALEELLARSKPFCVDPGVTWTKNYLCRCIGRYFNEGSMAR